MRVLMVTNIPAPYRLPIYELINERLGDDFKVLFCAALEPNRKWVLSQFRFNYSYLKKRKIYKRSDKFRDNYIHFNPDVLKEIKSFNPDVLINTGYNPTNLIGWMYTLFYKCRHVVMTDGTAFSESNLGWKHRLIRKVVFSSSKSFIGASKGSIELFKSYGVGEARCFRSHLCIDNQKFKSGKCFEDRQFDLMFSGQFLEGKLPLFFVEVANRVKKRLGSVNVLILGDGPLKGDILDALQKYSVDYTYPGFVDQNLLPHFYGNCKVFLFPTLNDPWGVVANEAMASGTPVITSPYAGVENDLVVNNWTGYVMETEVGLWVDAIVELLTDKGKWEVLSGEASRHVQNYNFDVAAEGIIKAATLANNAK